MKKKFVIIDHSLSNLQGHYFECSVSVAKAIQKQGYEAIIISNKQFSTDLFPTDIKIIPEFEVDWLNNYSPQPNRKRSFLQNVNKIFTSLNPSTLIDQYKTIINYQIFKLKLTQPKAKLFLEKVEGSTFRLNQWLKKDLNLIQYIPLVNTLWGLLKIIWGFLRFPFTLIAKKLNQLWQNLLTVNPKSFSQSFEDIIKSLELGIDDHVFIHTLSIEQVESILNILLNCQQEKLSKYHIMLRRDIDDYLVKNAQGIGIEACLNKFYQSKLFPEKVQFYTDTEQLVERYNSISAVEFLEIPVPFRQEKIEYVNLTNQTENKENQPIHLVYLGDARTEKGYLHLPQIVTDLWDKYLSTNKAKITIQSNFNINQGETGILASRLQLEQYPVNQVKIIKETLNTEEYDQLLLSADIVIIPYDVNSYRYRTSGILTEALAVGKPVIVPAESWLATQVDKTRAGIYQTPSDISKTIIKVINNLSEYQKNAQQFSINWQQKHSADNLIKILLTKTNFKFTKLAEKVVPNKIIFLLNAKTLLDFKQEGQIILSHLNSFTNLNFQIDIIFYLINNQLNPESDDHLVSDLLFFLSNYNINKIWYLFSLNQTPKYLDNLDKDQYLLDVYHDQASFSRNLIELNSLQIPETLMNYLQANKTDLIFLDSIESKVIVNNLPLNNIPIISQLFEFNSYKYALLNNQEISSKEWNFESDLYHQVDLILTVSDSKSRKIKTINPSLLVYNLPNYSIINDINSLVYQDNDFLVTIWGKNQFNYQQTINRSIEQLVEKVNFSYYLNETKKNVAILYPWGDILERKSGASQRVGLLLDFLISQGYYIWFFTIGEEKEFLFKQVRYNFYQQKFNQLDLVKQVYLHSYSNLITANQLNKNQLELDSFSDKNNLDNIAQDWRLSMYYQFAFDDRFSQNIAKIADWADLIFLEYPFWAKTVSKICQEKQVKLVVTSHDVIFQQVEENSPIQQILLAEEISNLQTANQVISVSKKDQELLAKNKIDSLVIPNPVKFNLIKEEELSDLLLSYLDDYPWLTENYCLFVGSQHYPNLEAVTQIKNIAQAYQQKSFQTQCNFIVVGSCCQGEIKENFIALGKVELELLQLIYTQAKLVIAPMLSGTGSSLKVMEAMSYGKVILGTEIAFRGYQIKSDQEAIINDNILEYPDIIQSLLSDQRQLKLIGEKAQKLAQQYDYNQVYQDYLKVISDLI